MTPVLRRKERRKTENELQRREFNTMRADDVKVKHWITLGTEALAEDNIAPPSAIRPSAPEDHSSERSNAVGRTLPGRG
jgi:hypothetical protein